MVGTPGPAGNTRSSSRSLPVVVESDSDNEPEFVEARESQETDDVDDVDMGDVTPTATTVARTREKGKAPQQQTTQGPATRQTEGAPEIPQQLYPGYQSNPKAQWGSKAGARPLIYWLPLPHWSELVQIKDMWHHTKTRGALARTLTQVLWKFWADYYGWDVNVTRFEFDYSMIWSVIGDNSAISKSGSGTCDRCLCRIGASRCFHNGRDPCATCVTSGMPCTLTDRRTLQTVVLNGRKNDKDQFFPKDRFTWVVVDPRNLPPMPQEKWEWYWDKEANASVAPRPPTRPHPYKNYVLPPHTTPVWKQEPPVPIHGHYTEPMQMKPWKYTVPPNEEEPRHMLTRMTDDLPVLHDIDSQLQDHQEISKGEPLPWPMWPQNPAVVNPTPDPSRPPLGYLAARILPEPNCQVARRKAKLAASRRATATTDGQDEGRHDHERTPTQENPLDFGLRMLTQPSSSRPTGNDFGLLPGPSQSGGNGGFGFTDPNDMGPGPTFEEILSSLSESGSSLLAGNQNPPQPGQSNVSRPAPTGRTLPTGNRRALPETSLPLPGQVIGALRLRHESGQREDWTVGTAQAPVGVEETLKLLDERITKLEAANTSLLQWAARENKTNTQLLRKIQELRRGRDYVWNATAEMQRTLRAVGLADTFQFDTSAYAPEPLSPASEGNTPQVGPIDQLSPEDIANMLGLGGPRRRFVDLVGVTNPASSRRMSQGLQGLGISHGSPYDVPDLSLTAPDVETLNNLDPALGGSGGAARPAQSQPRDQATGPTSAPIDPSLVYSQPGAQPAQSAQSGQPGPSGQAKQPKKGGRRLGSGQGRSYQPVNPRGPYRPELSKTTAAEKAKRNSRPDRLPHISKTGRPTAPRVPLTKEDEALVEEVKRRAAARRALANARPATQDPEVSSPAAATPVTDAPATNAPVTSTSVTNALTTNVPAAASPVPASPPMPPPVTSAPAATPAPATPAANPPAPISHSPPPDFIEAGYSPFPITSNDLNFWEYDHLGNPDPAPLSDPLLFSQQSTGLTPPSFANYPDPAGLNLAPTNVQTPLDLESLALYTALGPNAVTQDTGEYVFHDDEDLMDLS